MRILTVANDLVPYGGLERMQLEIHQELVRRGHETDLVYTGEGTLSAAWDAIAVRHLIASTRIFSGHPRSGTRALLDLTGVLRNVRPDVIHMHHYRHLHAVVPAARLTRTPVLLHLHSTAPATLGCLGRRLIQAPDRVIAVSNDTAQAWSHFRSDIGVVRNGVDLNHYRPVEHSEQMAAREQLGLPTEAFVVGFTGRLTPEKGIEALVETWALLDWPHDRARLVVAGRGDAAFEAHLQAIGPRVDFLGFLDDARLLYDVADVMAVPSMWPDPCPRAVVEAMASGKGLVASRTGGIPELVCEGGSLVEPGSRPALASALSQLEADPDEHRRLGRVARAHAEIALDLTTSINQVEEHLTAMISTGGRR